MPWQDLAGRCEQAETALASLRQEYDALAKEAHALKEGMLHEQFNAEKATDHSTPATRRSSLKKRA